MQSVRVNQPQERQQNRWRTIGYWALLASSWLVFLPNILELKMPDGNPPPLWILSPILGLAAVILAVFDRAWVRAGIALIFGVGAAWIGFVVTVLLFGP